MSLLSVAISLLLTLAPGPSFTDDETPPPPEGFASPEATAAYTEGVAQFESGEFDAAEESFKDAKKGAKDDAKKQIAAYVKACKGAKNLTKIEKGIQQEKWRPSYNELEKLERTHGDTPLSSHLKPLRETIEAGLFYWIANFEEKSPEPEALVKEKRPPSASLNSDKEFIQEGEGSLKWRSGEGPGFAGMAFGMLPLGAFEGTKIEEYRYLEIHLFSTDENFGKFTLYFGVEEGGPGGFFMGTEILKTRCILHHITVEKPGWHHVRVDLWKDITKNNSVDWKDVTGVSLMVIPPSHPKTIYLDGIRLEKP